MPSADLWSLRCYKRSRLPRLSLVRITFRNRAPWNAVRGEQYRQLCAVLSTSLGPARAQLFREGLDQQGMVVPFFDEVDGKRRTAPEQHLLVEPNASPRVVRRKADCNCTLDAIGGHLLQGVSDEGMPVAHAHVSGDAQLASHSIRLLASDPGERRAANQRVAMLDLAHHGLGHWPPARNVLQKFRNVFDPLRSAMSDQQQSFFAHCV